MPSAPIPDSDSSLPFAEQSSAAARASGAPAQDAAAGEIAAVLGPEQPLWSGRMSWKHQAGHLCGWLVACIVLIGVWAHFRQPDTGPWLGRAVLLLILGSGAGLLVRSALVVYRVRYRLTTQRLFIDQGILSKTTDQTELFRVDDVRIRQAPFDRIFHVGDVELIAPSDTTQASHVLVGVPEPEIVAEHIRTHSRALRMKRALFVEQV